MYKFVRSATATVVIVIKVLKYTYGDLVFYSLFIKQDKGVHLVQTYLHVRCLMESTDPSCFYFKIS